MGVAAFFLLPREYVSSAHLAYEGVEALDGNVVASPVVLIETSTMPGHLRQVRERLGSSVSLRTLESRVSSYLGPDGRSMVVEAKGDSPAEAQALASAFVDVFLEGQAASVATRLEASVADVSESLEGARLALEAARKQHGEFQTASGEADAVTERTRLLTRANKLRADAEEQGVEAEAQQARIEELKKAQKELPATIVSSAKKGTAIDAALAKARADLAAARANLSSEHPRVQALEGQVESLKAQQPREQSGLSEQVMASNPAREAVERDLARAKVALAAATEKRQSLIALADKLQQEADGMVVLEGDALRLQSDAKAAELRHAELQDRATRLRDAAQNPGSGFRVVSAPSLPEEAAGSGFRWAILFVLPLVGALLVALFVAARELDGLRVQTAREVAWWGRGPVLGTSRWPRYEDALDDFVNEMEDVGMIGVGRTLVVPATEAEREIACAFALRLGQAPWLAAAILDVEARNSMMPIALPAVPEERRLPVGVASPAVRDRPSLPPDVPPRPSAPPRVLRPSKPTIEGFAPPTPVPPASVRAPAPKAARLKRTKQGFGVPGQADMPRASSAPPSRPPRKRTLVGVPPSSSPPPPDSPPNDAQAIPLGRRSSRPPRLHQSTPPLGTPLFHGVSHATVRMAVREPREPIRSNRHAEVVLTRPVILAGEPTKPRPSPRNDPMHVRRQPSSEPVSASVMQAAITVLNDESSSSARGTDGFFPNTDVAVALGWNGPLRGPVMRRAARLSHRVIVVVSAGMPALQLSGVATRLGRDDGVGYVLVNLADHYAHLPDRVGDVEAFWRGMPPGQQG